MLNINSNLEYRFWPDSDIDSFGLKNIKLYNNISNLGAKSDILRYDILERFNIVHNYKFDYSFDGLQRYKF
jgi:hypothetical protein